MPRFHLRTACNIEHQIYIFIPNSCNTMLAVIENNYAPTTDVYFPFVVDSSLFYRVLFMLFHFCSTAFIAIFIGMSMYIH